MTDNNIYSEVEEFNQEVFKNITTKLYYNVYDSDVFVCLAENEQIIEQSDIDRGFILKRELVNYFGSLIEEKKLGPDSYLIESDSAEYRVLELPIKSDAE